MRVLVTGAAGTVGTAFTRLARKQGIEVVGLDRREPIFLKMTDYDSFVRADLQHEMPYIDPVATDVVVHAAANARVFKVVQEPWKAIENMVTLQRTLEWCRTNEKPMIFLSSREVYSDTGDRAVQEHDTQVWQDSPYAATKLGGEALVHAYGKCYGLNYLIVRLSNVYGKYDYSDRLVPVVMQKLYQNESPIVIFGGREKAYHFSYVDDVATNLIELSKQLLEKRFQDVLMIAGEWATLWEVAEHALRTVQDHHVELIERPHRTGEIMRCRLDLTRMQGMGLRMPTTVKDGVERAAAWYRDHERYKFVGIHG